MSLIKSLSMSPISATAEPKLSFGSYELSVGSSGPRISTEEMVPSLEVAGGGEGGDGIYGGCGGGGGDGGGRGGEVGGGGVGGAVGGGGAGGCKHKPLSWSAIES